MLVAKTMALPGAGIRKTSKSLLSILLRHLVCRRRGPKDEKDLRDLSEGRDRLTRQVRGSRRFPLPLPDPWLMKKSDTSAIIFMP